MIIEDTNVPFPCAMTLFVDRVKCWNIESVLERSGGWWWRGRSQSEPDELPETWCLVVIIILCTSITCERVRERPLLFPFSKACFWVDNWWKCLLIIQLPLRFVLLWNLIDLKLILVLSRIHTLIGKILLKYEFLSLWDIKIKAY